MAAALYSASAPPFLLPCWAWRQITHQRACPRVAEIMKILHNWLHCFYKQRAHSCLPLKKMLFVGFLAFLFFPLMLACEQDISSFPRTKKQHGHGHGYFGLDSWEKLQSTLNALGDLRRGSPRMARKSQTRKICGTQLIGSAERKETGLKPQTIFWYLRCEFNHLNSAICIETKEHSQAIFMVPSRTTGF